MALFRRDVLTSSAAKLPAEDAVVLQKQREKGSGTLRTFRSIANFDDADPLIQEPTVAFQWVPRRANPSGCRRGYPLWK